MERWAEAADDQMEESLVMERAGLCSENKLSNGVSLLMIVWME